MSTRLNKYIAQAGVASRRGADDLISAGKVTINGTQAALGDRVEAGDVVTVNGKTITPHEETVIVLFNKPRGVTTTKSDPHAKQTLVDVLPKKYHHLNPVGRLDRQSEGLLLLTNDGDLQQRLTHPSYEHEKEYEVSVRQPLSDADLQQLAAGIQLEEGKTNQTTVKRTGQKSFRIVLTQGWNRQIRRMVEAVDNHVVHLRRIRSGKLELGALQPGEYREITQSDLGDV